jgi:hypothetical protein
MSGDNLLAMPTHSGQLDRYQRGAGSICVQGLNTDCDWTARPIEEVQAKQQQSVIERV